MVHWRAADSPASAEQRLPERLGHVVEFLDLLGPGLVEEVVQLLPPVALLAEVEGELAEVRLGEAEQRAARIRLD